MSKPHRGDSVVETLIAFSGNENAVVVRPAFVKFTGSLEAGMLLSQLLYWRPRTGRSDDWFYKSDKELQEELCLSRRAVRNAKVVLRKLEIITTRTRRANGAPVTHYNINLDVLGRKWQEWIQEQNAARTEEDSRLSQMGQSIVPNETIRLSHLGQFLTETTQRGKQRRRGSAASISPEESKPPKPVHRPMTQEEMRERGYN